MKRKWIIPLIIFLCGVGFAYKFVLVDMRDGLCKQLPGEETLSPSVSEDVIIETKEKDISITQHEFTGDDIEMQDLGALDDKGIAHAVGFYDTFGTAFELKDGEPSMFSCEDVDTERLKQGLKGKCKRYKIKYKQFSFVVLNDNPLLFTENGKIYFKNNNPEDHSVTEIIQYNMGKDLDFTGVIEQSEVWLNKKYCLRPYYSGNAFRYLGRSWIGGLGKNLNKLYNEKKLQLYIIYEFIDGKCTNNGPGILLYEEGGHKFYTFINNKPSESIIYYDGIYSTPFSIDIE